MIKMNMIENPYFNKYQEDGAQSEFKDGDQCNFYLGKKVNINKPISSSDLDQKMQFIDEQSKAEGVDKFVVCGLLLNNKNILIVTRSMTDDHAPGFVEIPGGGAELGETLIQALKREIFEEVGSTDFVIYDILGYFDIYYGGIWHKQINFLLVTENNQIRLNPEEHMNYQWEILAGMNLKNFKFHSMGEEIMIAYLQDLVSR